ncbi:MAG: hypothetical protein AAB834_04820, partial [Patescibacteria group bacterium]
PYSVSIGPVNLLQVFLQNTPPAAPTVSGGTGKNVTRETTESLSWNPSPDPEGDLVTYAVFAGTAPDSKITLAQNLGSPSFVLTGMVFVTTYYWQVGAKDSFGAWAYSPTVSVVHSFLNTAPSSPIIQGASLRSLHAKEPFGDTIAWQASQDAEGDAIAYSIYLATTPSQSVGSYMGLTTGTALSLAGLRFDTTYYAVIAASDVYGMGSQSSIFSFNYRQGNSQPSEPVSISTGGILVTRQTAFPLSWQASSDLDGDSLTYSLWTGTNPTNLQLTQNGTNHAGELKNLAFDTTYYWKVGVEDSFGSLVEGATQSVVLVFKNSPPTQPIVTSSSGLITTRNQNYTLTWIESRDADFDPVIYQVFWGTSTEGLTSQEASKASFPIGSLNFSTTYYFQVIAHDPYGGVSSSPLVSVY